MKRRLPILVSIALTAGALVCLPVAAWPGVLGTLAEIVVTVSAIAVVTGVLEYRACLRRIGWVAGPLIRFGRLPEAGRDAFFASFASGSVAAMMLAEGVKEGRLSRREMIVCGLCATVPPVFFFQCYLMLPVVGILGVAGALYFGVSLAVMGVTLGIFLLFARFTLVGGTSASAAPPIPALPWPETWHKSRLRALKFLRRVLLLTVPFYLWTAYAFRCGRLDFTLPDGLAALLSPEALAVIAARVGGLLAAAGSAAELLRHHQIPVAQLLLALLIGNVLNGFTRLLRRGMPVSLGIYPGYDGALIASVGVGTRMALTFGAIIIVWSMQ